jgi:hydroxymethylglutaryl-CoA reductase
MDIPSMPRRTSSIPRFRDLDIGARRALISEIMGMDPAELAGMLEGGGLDAEGADRMVENAIGTLALPFGVALNLQINGVDYLAPMAIEEPSVIAAASHAAKRVRAGGGFQASVDEPLMIAQIELHDVPDPAAAVARIRAARDDLFTLADRAVPNLCERGGGARELTVRDVGDGIVVTHLYIDCRDAMGANMLNTVAEALGPQVARIAGGALGLRILSNFCDRRCTRVSARVPVAELGDSAAAALAAARGIVHASRFAERDPYRAATHNKGIMNGVDAVVVATGNDWRAVEAGAHAFASRTGRYGPLSTFRLVDEERALEAQLELPLALGTVGGALRAHPGARAALAISGAGSAAELSMIAAAAGLATNLAALRALATEGIQRGHMALHHRAMASKIAP